MLLEQQNSPSVPNICSFLFGIRGRKWKLLEMLLQSAVLDHGVASGSVCVCHPMTSILSRKPFAVSPSHKKTVIIFIPVILLKFTTFEHDTLWQIIVHF